MVIRSTPQVKWLFRWLSFFSCLLFSPPADAAINIPITVNLSETVDVTGTPRIPVDVGGVTRYASYTSGTGTNTLTFTLAPQPGDVDLDGVTVSSPINLNGGSIKDTKGNDATLTFTPPNTTNVKVNYPSFSMDFVADSDGRYTLNGTVHNDLGSFLTAAGGSFTRSSTGTYFDSSGQLQTAGTDTPRFDYHPITHQPKGILIEDTQTNSIRNSQAIGSVIGSPGSLPTNWIFGRPTGITNQVIGSGTINGMPYVDVRFSGTPSIAGDCAADPESGMIISATSGETWTFSVYIALIAGSWPSGPDKPIISVRERDSGGILTGNTDYNMRTAVTTSDLTRVSVTRTLNNASSVYVSPAIRLTSLVIGTPIDVTFRIAGPQLEKAVFATSYIPTTSGAVTRARDSLTMPLNSWFSGSEGTFSFLFDTHYNSATNVPNSVVFSLDDTTINNRITYFSSIIGLGTPRYYADEILTATQTRSSGVALVKDISRNAAVTYKVNDFAHYETGALQSIDTSMNIPVTTGLTVGGRRNATVKDSLNGHITNFRYYPTRIAGPQLQLLTQ